MPSEITVVDETGSPLDTPVSGLTVHRELAAANAELCRLSVAETSTDWYRHPDREIYGFVRDGRLGIRSRSGGDTTTVKATAGDCLRIPAGVDHRLSVRGDAPATVLAALVGSGPSFETVTEPQPSATKPVVAHAEAFVSTQPLANLTRRMPFPDAAVQQVVGHADSRITSEWHHHGDNDVFGYVIEGEGYVDDGSNEPLLATAGSWFHVPAGVVHRDVNPVDAEQDYVLWLTGSEPRIVYVD